MDIQSVIIRYGISKAEIARQLESSNSYVTQLTSGQSTPSMKMLDKLASIIGCKRWEFFLDEIKSDPHGVERFIDEMDRDEVAQILGMTVPAAAQPEAEPRQEEHSDAGASELPIGGNQPSVPASLICPHCGTAFIVEVKERK